MSSILGSVARVIRFAGALSAEIRERNRWWILYLEKRKLEAEGKMRASGSIGPAGIPAQALTVGAGTALAAEVVASADTAGALLVNTPAANGWNWPDPGNGAHHAGHEAE